MPSTASGLESLPTMPSRTWWPICIRPRSRTRTGTPLCWVTAMAPMSDRVSTLPTPRMT